MKFYNFKSSARTVPLEIHIAGFPGQAYCPRMVTMNKPIYDAIGQYSNDKPVIVFTSSRRQTRFTASSLICQLLMNSNPKRWLSDTNDEINDAVEKIEDLNLKGFLPFGNFF